MPELLTRTFALPTSIDAARRSFDVIFSTGSAVQRRDTRGPYIETLSLDPSHVRLASLIGAPLLNGHRQATTGDVLGAVTQAATDGLTGHATVRMSRRPDVEPIWQDVQDGILRSVSVGYSVDRWQDGTDANGVRTRHAIDWTPREISLVPIPADAGATVRTFDMNETTIADPPATETRAGINVAIRAVARVAGLDAAFADTLIDNNATVEQARAAAFAELERRQAGPIITHRVEMGVSHDAPDTIRARMEDALVARLRPGQVPPEAARPYMAMPLARMAAALLEARGERGLALLGPEAILSRAMHTASDFPNLLQGTGFRVLQAAYQAAPNPLKMLCRPAQLPDFRAKSLLKLSNMPKLQPVTEAGQIQSVTRGEAKEGYALTTFAQIFSLSRQALINDDLGAFSDWAVAMGNAAAETEANQLVTLLISNSGAGPTMNDGNALFSTAHSNLATSGALPSISTLGGARQAMRQQTGLDGVTPINATPKFILVNPALETAAQQVLWQTTPNSVDEVNPFGGALTLLVEPRLTANAWYLFADPATLPCIEYGHLASAPGPQLASRSGWDTLGVEFRCVLDFGCGAIEHRGAYRNPGQ